MKKEKIILQLHLVALGGVHRSVVSAEYFHSFLKKKKEIDAFIDHRDLKI